MTVVPVACRRMVAAFAGVAAVAACVGMAAVAAVRPCAVMAARVGLVVVVGVGAEAGSAATQVGGSDRAE